MDIVFVSNYICALESTGGLLHWL